MNIIYGATLGRLFDRKQSDEVTINFGREKYRVQHRDATGAGLRLLFGIPPVDDVYRAKGSKIEGGPIGYDQLVELENGDDFTSSPAMYLYDYLPTHMEECERCLRVIGGKVLGSGGICDDCLFITRSQGSEDYWPDTTTGRNTPPPDHPLYERVMAHRAFRALQPVPAQEK